MTFEPFQLHPRVASGVNAAGYASPTPIQREAIPAAVSGRDVLGLAQTGTGKTAAFVLPILNRLIDGPRGKVRALVIAPTRELAEQIHEEFRSLGRATGLRSATVYGGVGMAPQIKALRAGTDIVVACPGRLLDHLQRGNADLSAVEALVLDEADHMFDMGFLPAIRQLVARVPKGAQRLLFSATMPDELRGLARTVLNDPVTVEIGRAAPAETVSHALLPVANHQKTALLEHLLRTTDTRSALVFTRTKRGAKRLAEKLDKANVFVASLQGNLSQSRRREAMDGFREGRYHVLVATDIAARGIDVSRVEHVVNFDVPSTPEAYTHRIGRTGRAERSGEAFTFVTPEDEATIRAIERSLGTRIERTALDGFSYDRAAAQADTGAARAAAPAPSRERGAPSPERRRRRGGRGGRGGQNGQGGRGRNRNGAAKGRDD